MPARTLVLLALASSAVAFTPPAASSATRSAVRIAADVAVEPTPPPAPKPVPTYNGWAADAKLPCFGLPGAVSPLGFFDPLGFSDGAELDTVKRYREAEIMHGRIAMMAFVGFLVDENTPTITYGFDHPVIGINMLADTAGTVAFAFFLFINLCEAFRANKGWVEPGLGPLFSLRENYYPGDLGFDPLGLKPTAAKDFSSMHTKELSNGRLAMLAVAGIVAQELIDGKSILGHFGI